MPKFLCFELNRGDKIMSNLKSITSITLLKQENDQLREDILHYNSMFKFFDLIK